MPGLTRANFYVKQINSSRFHFIEIVELIICLECLKTGLKLKILKLEV